MIIRALQRPASRRKRDNGQLRWQRPRDPPMLQVHHVEPHNASEWMALRSHLIGAWS